jgi:hypothetical protein
MIHYPLKEVILLYRVKNIQEIKRLIYPIAKKQSAEKIIGCKVLTDKNKFMRLKILLLLLIIVKESSGIIIIRRPGSRLIFINS